MNGHYRPMARAVSFVHSSISSRFLQPAPFLASTSCCRQHQTLSDSCKRNPVLAAVIREGLPGLHETATLIQTSSKTRQSLTVSNQNEVEQSPKYKYNLFHIQEAVLYCLEEWVLQQEQSMPNKPSWSIQGEPVEILHVKLSSSLQHAVIYWTIPYSLAVPADHDELTTTSSSHDDDSRLIVRLDTILELQDQLHQQWTTQQPNNRLLCQAIQSRLRNYNRWTRVPEMRLAPASPWMLRQFLLQQK